MEGRPVTVTLDLLGLKPIQDKVYRWYAASCAPPRPKQKMQGGWEEKQQTRETLYGVTDEQDFPSVSPISVDEEVRSTTDETNRG